MTTPGVDHRLRHRAALLSLLVGLLMLGLKMGAYLLTGSATILSDALESVVHVAAVGFMFWCFRFASAPPDAEHPYGHGKAEYLSIGFEGGAIVLAAAAIVWEAVVGLIDGHQPARVDLGFGLIVLAALINLALGGWLVHVGRKTRSALLEADGHHVLSDVWTSAGVVVGVGVLWLMPTDSPARVWIDSGVAILLAMFILWVGGRLVRQAMRGLLDEADPQMVERVVAAINEVRDPAWRDVHNLRLRRSGDAIFVDFHLVVPSLWSVAAAHAAVEKLEQHILRVLGAHGAVMIHLDHPHSDPTVGMDPPPGEQETRAFTVAQATRFKQG
jgi:cation diffusion facilitator family transporter